MIVVICGVCRNICQSILKMNPEEYKLHKLLTDFTTLEQYIECFLIKYDVRQAYLLEGCQCLGKRETGLFARIFSKDNCKIHSSIKKWFPELVETHCPGLGTFISKEKIDLNKIKNDDDVGRILGYPAWNGFSKLDRHVVHYSFSIRITFKDYPIRFKHFFEDVYIISNVSSNDITEDMEIIRRKIEYVLKVKSATESGTGSELIIQEYIDTISVDKTVHYPIIQLITKLIENDILMEEEKDEIRNYIWNIIDSNNNLAQYEFEWNNPIQAGIIVCLLLQHENHELEPFYNYFREKHPKAAMSSAINRKYALELIKVLDMAKQN